MKQNPFLKSYLQIYIGTHNFFKAFSFTEKQREDYTSNIFTFSFILLSDFIGFFTALGIPEKTPIDAKYQFLILGIIILVLNSYLILKNKNTLAEIKDDKNPKLLCVFTIVSMLLSLWPFLLFLKG